MRSLLVALMMAMIALAGCTSDEPAPVDTDGDQGTDPTGGGGSDDGGDDPADDECTTGDASCDAVNDPPTGEFAPNATTGEAPLNVLFSFNGTDVDDDQLSWSLDVNGDGMADSEGNENALPGNFSFTYTEPGEYIAKFVLSDGSSNLTMQELITVNATTGEGGEEEEPEGPPQFEDRDFYLYEYATGMCHAKVFTDNQDLGLVYSSSEGLGGDWNFVETNDVAGLQLQDNHPLGGGQGLFFDLPVGSDCVDGDQTAT